MDKKKLIGIVAALAMALASYFLKEDVKGAICGVEVEAPIAQ